MALQYFRTERISAKGRTIRKVMGGWGWAKNQKKIHATENAKKKNSCKEEGKEKKINAEGRSNCDFFRKSEFQKSTTLPGIRTI